MLVYFLDAVQLFLETSILSDFLAVSCIAIVIMVAQNLFVNKVVLDS